MARNMTFAAARQARRNRQLLATEKDPKRAPRTAAERTAEAQKAPKKEGPHGLNERPQRDREPKKGPPGPRHATLREAPAPSSSLPSLCPSRDPAVAAHRTLRSGNRVLVPIPDRTRVLLYHVLVLFAILMMACFVLC